MHVFKIQDDLLTWTEILFEDCANGTWNGCDEQLASHPSQE